MSGPLNVIQSRLQVERGIAYFFQHHRGERFATAKTMADVTRPFVAAIEEFARVQGLDLIPFSRRQRKDDVAREYLADFHEREGPPRQWLERTPPYLSCWAAVYLIAANAAFGEKNLQLANADVGDLIP